MPAVPEIKPPQHRSLMRDLSDALSNWTSSQRVIVGLAAEFADSDRSETPRTASDRYSIRW